jgi:hypothetical protein
MHGTLCDIAACLTRLHGIAYSVGLRCRRMDVCVVYLLDDGADDMWSSQGKGGGFGFD